MKKVEMILTVGGKRALMPIKYYDEICTFIVRELEQNDGLRFVELLDKADSVIGSEMRGNLSWYLLHVKHDLQARNIIRVERDVNRVQIIQLRRKYKEKLRAFRAELKMPSGTDRS
ncbi:MAG TPA: hypothetical protein VD884_08750 [Ohtaekwangia sp.]|nr:hypothetical protein [Ohtaekwangia sp.]